MTFLKRRFTGAPEGTAVLFFIQIFATLGFAVLYSTLVLYATKHLHLGVKEATTLMGVFGAFNYGLHLFGGYLGGRFLSNRNLFVGGMALQVIGCACIATGTLALFYVGLALFLTGSGLNVTCINMMLTQRFTPEDPRREGAFLWNYAGMNVGFFVGFTAAGYFQATQSYSSLFIFATLGNFGPLVLASLLTRMRARGWRIDIPKQFATSLLLMALAFLILPLGIKLAGADGKSAFVWLFLSYVLQSIGELLIMPIGYAMIGKLAPRQYQGVMMGSWMLVTGLASLFAGDFSGMIPEPKGTTAVATNPEYAKLFGALGAGSLLVGVALVLLIPFLRKLITDKAETFPVEVPATVVPVV